MRADRQVGGWFEDILASEVEKLLRCVWCKSASAIVEACLNGVIRCCKLWVDEEW